MKIQLTRNDFFRHILVWIFVVFAIHFSYIVKGDLICKLLYVSITVGNLMLSYYLIYILILPIFYKSSKAITIVLIVLTAILFVCIDYLLVMVILKKLGGQIEHQLLSIFDFVLTAIHIFSFTLIASLGSYYNKISIERNRESAELSKSILQTELDFLKSQFNSHLTFNFLNLCYARLIGKSGTATKALECYSEMLQYSLFASSNKYVLIEKEIGYIENFIEVQKLLTTKCYCNLKVNVKDPSKYFAPMILCSFIENAFKHGVIDDENTPIVIDITQNDSMLYVIINNKVENIKTPFVEGYGLTKTRQTLDVLYPTKYVLEANFDNSCNFNVELSVIIS